MTAVDWSRWRKCMYCFAETGSPCTTKTGTEVVGGKVRHVTVTKTQPHRGRKLRTGGA